MGSKDTPRTPKWRATFLGGPNDGLVTDVGGFNGPVPHNFTIPIPCDGDGFDGVHTYFVTGLDIIERLCEFSYTGEIWTPAVLED